MRFLRKGVRPVEFITRCNVITPCEVTRPGFRDLNKGRATGVGRAKAWSGAAQNPYWTSFPPAAPGNQEWVKNAPALIFLASKPTRRPHGSDQDAPSTTHSLNAGAASGYMALQAHPTVQRAPEVLGVPPQYRIEDGMRSGDRQTRWPCPKRCERASGPALASRCEQLRWHI